MSWTLRRLFTPKTVVPLNQRKSLTHLVRLYTYGRPCYLLTACSSQLPACFKLRSAVYTKYFHPPSFIHPQQVVHTNVFLPCIRPTTHTTTRARTVFRCWCSKAEHTTTHTIRPEPPAATFLSCTVPARKSLYCCALVQREAAWVVVGY